MTEGKETEKLNCSRCRTKHDLEHFTKNPKTNDFYKICNKCRQYKQDNREQILEQGREHMKEYYQNNREQILEKRKERRDSNPEHEYRKIVCEKCQKLVMYKHMGRRRATKKCLEAQAKQQEK